MEPLRPPRGLSRRHPRVPINQPCVSGFSNSLPPEIRGPRPIISPSLRSSQPLQTPVTGMGMLRSGRSMPPRPTLGRPHQTAPRPLESKLEMIGDNIILKQNEMTEVRILLIYHIINIHLYSIFFKVQKITKSIKHLGAGNVFFI